MSGVQRGTITVCTNCCAQLVQVSGVQRGCTNCCAHLVQVSGVQRGTITVEAIRDIVYDLGVPGSKISPTSHAGVLVMLSQALVH